jgi:hypothetical protein
MMRISSADQHEDVGYRIGVEFGGRWWLLGAFEERGGELGEMSKKRVSPFLWAVLLRGCFFWWLRLTIYRHPSPLAI